MSRSSNVHSPRRRVGTNYTAHHFEAGKITIVEYTKDFIAKNEVNGIKFSRGAVNGAFEANVSKVYPEGHPKREELLQQVSMWFFLAHLVQLATQNLWLDSYSFNPETKILTYGSHRFDAQPYPIIGRSVQT